MIKINEDVLHIVVSFLFFICCICVVYSAEGRGIEAIIGIPLAGFCGIAVIAAFVKYIFKKYDITIEITKEK